MNLWRGRLTIKYIFFEMLPIFVLGVLVFLFIILMFQAFRMAEYVIIHGADLATVGQILGTLAISFLPVILPMSLLFTILLIYGRMSSDSEIVAFKALGLNMTHITFPAVVLAALTAVLSAETSFYLAPWGNRQMELIVHRLGKLKPGATIREGVFSEGFFDLVVYANEVDSKAGRLKSVFIYDERDVNSPLTIIAREGRLIREETASGNKAFLRLFQGNIHRTQTGEKIYTKIDFDSYDINLFDPVVISHKNKTPLSYNLPELREALGRADVSDKLKRSLEVEIHRRWAISSACLIFAFLGVGLGTTTNKRQARAGGFVVSIGVIVFYWMIYAGLENLGKNGHLPIPIAVWTTNVIFAGLAVWALRRAARS